MDGAADHSQYISTMVEIDKLKPTAASAIIVCAATFFSVQLMIFLLNPALFYRLDTFRLVMVGLGLATPTLLVNIVIFRLSDNRKLAHKLLIGKEETEKIVWTTAGIYTVFIIAFVSLIAYSYHFSLYRAVWIIFWVEAIILLFGVIASPTAPNKPLPDKTNTPKQPDS